MLLHSDTLFLNKGHIYVLEAKIIFKTQAEEFKFAQIKDPSHFVQSPYLYGPVGSIS
jgi:hypothetical protein